MATPIKATLTLDTSNYRAGLKRATDDTKRFSEQTKQSNATASAAFDRLKTAIAGIGFAALIRQVQTFSNAVDGMARFTGTSVGTILGLQQAFVGAGGTADRARDAISDLTKNLGEAQLGSKELTASFAKVNISMTQLQTLSKQDILKKTIEGLLAIPDEAQRTAVGFKLMGESIKGIDLAKLNADLEKNIAINSKYSGAVSTAGAAGANLSVHLERLTVALAQVTEPLNKLVAAMDVSVETIVSVIKIIGLVTAAWFTFAKVIPQVRTVLNTIDKPLRGSGGLLALLWEQLKQTGREFLSFIKGMARAAGVMDNVKSSAFSFAAGLAGLGRALLRIGGWLGIAYAAFEALDLIIRKLTGTDISGWFTRGVAAIGDWIANTFPQVIAAFDKLKSYFNIGNTLDTSESANEMDRLIKKSRELEVAQKATQDAAKALAGELKAMNEGFASANEQLSLQSEAYAENLRFQTSLVGVSSDLADRQTKLREATKSYTDEIIKQRAAISQIQAQADQPGATDAEKANARAKIDVINQQIAKLYELGNIAAGNADKEISQLQAKQRANRELIATIQTYTELENARASAFGFSLTALEKYNQLVRSPEGLNLTAKEVAILGDRALAIDKINAAALKENLLGERAAQLSELKSSLLGVETSALQKLEEEKSRNPTAWLRKTEEEKSILEETAKQIDATTEKYRALAFARDLVRQGEDYTAQLRDQLSLDQAVGEAARQRIQIEINGRTALASKIREINDRYGDEANLTEALRQRRSREIAEATAGYARLTATQKQASDENQKIRNTFEFGWSQSFKTYVEEANNAATEAQTYFNAFSRGFEDAIVKFVQTGKFNFKDLANTIIAEFAKIQAKKLLSNILGGGGSGGGFSLGNLFSGIGNLFGGLFANGGTLGAGKWGIAGEAGPEIVQGPASITPLDRMGGGQTSVTYNINAVDAASFRTMVARDPEFLYAVTEQGRRSLPNRSRR